VNIEPERVKLKNLLCYKPSPGNGLWRQSSLGKGLAGTVVIFKEWRLTMAL
jgi:hypothetical protein